MTNVINLKILKKNPKNETPPRSIYCWTQWRAHEFLYFLLYYGLPVFYQLIPYNMYTNLTKLVIFMEIILSSKICKNELKIAEKIIIQFIEELVSLYDESIMLSGMHELVHLVDCTF